MRSMGTALAVALSAVTAASALMVCTAEPGPVRSMSTASVQHGTDPEVPWTRGRGEVPWTRATTKAVGTEAEPEVPWTGPTPHAVASDGVGAPGDPGGPGDPLPLKPEVPWT
ncbi:hypothetical protein ACFVIM_00875 [Streptomyces sp. NPDC057638]|uniref:hypothetical protein n=1 Tax=Streptomyces sp. NPDC057638 TaxID=3346190 RepID=UPI0036BFBA25